jgi:hypothetical protein
MTKPTATWSYVVEIYGQCDTKKSALPQFFDSRIARPSTISDESQQPFTLLRLKIGVALVVRELVNS